MGIIYSNMAVMYDDRLTLEQKEERLQEMNTAKGKYNKMVNVAYTVLLCFVIIGFVTVNSVHYQNQDDHDHSKEQQLIEATFGSPGAIVWFTIGLSVLRVFVCIILARALVNFWVGLDTDFL